jgi:hypothetical protein
MPCLTPDTEQLRKYLIGILGNPQTQSPLCLMLIVYNTRLSQPFTSILLINTTLLIIYDSRCHFSPMLYYWLAQPVPVGYECPKQAADGNKMCVLIGHLAPIMSVFVTHTSHGGLTQLPTPLTRNLLFWVADTGIVACCLQFYQLYWSG